MKRWSDKRRVRNDEAREFRKKMVERADGCEICGCSASKPRWGRPSFLSQLCVHEIANGPNRRAAQDKQYATLVVCWGCNADLNNKGDDDWPETRQLALLAMARPYDFDLREYNALVNPRAPRRITLFEVFEEMARAKEKAQQTQVSNRLFTPDEVAFIMNVDRKTVRRWIDAGHLRAINVAPPGATKRHFRVDPCDLRLFAQSRQTMSPEDYAQIVGDVQENWE